MEKPNNTRQYHRPSERAFDYIINKIRNGTFSDGQRIKERQIAKDLNMSHIPVREAMEKLQKLAWVDRVPYKGIMVKQFDEKDIEKLSQVREILETGAISITAKTITETQLQQLKEYVDDFEKASKSKDTILYQEIDSKFHKFLIDLLNNEILSNLFETMVIQSKGFFLASAMQAAFMWNEDVENFEFSSHKHLYNALATGDYSAAEDLIREHVKAGCRVAVMINKTKNTMAKGVIL